MIKKKLILAITVVLAVTGVSLLAFYRSTTAPAVSHGEFVINYSGFIENLSNITSPNTTIRTPVSAPGSRFVWAAGDGSTFNLTPLNFDGFYYDLDNNAGSESFSIELGNPDNRSINRSIKENDLKYSTIISNIPFKYRQFGNYSMIGFMGERYFAGYSSDSPITRSPVNLLNHGLLLGILIDENVNRTLIAGRGMALSDGYAIWLESANVNEGTAKISIIKNGEEVDSRSVKAGDTYIFKKDMPIIAIHIDSVLPEKNVPVVRIKGIFQLSDSYTKIQSDSESWIYGVMKITNISDKGISMANMNPINLRYPYSTEYELNSIGIMRNFGFKVADSEILRFLVEREYMDYINHKPRGAVYTESSPVMAWDGLNFPIFMYDLDSGNYSQRLEITNISGRTIPAHGLKYTAFVTDVPYTVTKKTGIRPANGSYKAVGLGAEKYAAVEGKSSRLAKILLDNGTDVYDKKILLEGETWNMGDGYSLTIKSVDATSSPIRVQLELRQNGIELDEKWISQGNVYTFAGRHPSEENGLPIFVTYINSIFFGEVNPYYIELRYTWLVSENVTDIKEGDRLGVFLVTGTEPDYIVLENERAINLSAGSCINLMENLGFVVADSGELRFYPSGMEKCDQS